MNIGRITLGMAVALSVASLPAAAEEGWNSPACKADFERLCKDVTPGEGRLFQCISQHLDELSPDCRSSAHSGHQALHGNARPAGGSCREDAATHCADVPHGSGGLFDCLQKKYQLLSPGCQAMVQAMRMRITKVNEDCKPEIGRFCADGVPVSRCLGDHLDALSAECRTTLTSGFGTRPARGMPADHPPTMLPPPQPQKPTQP